MSFGRLPALGWEPVVVTGPSEPRAASMPLDTTLEAELPATVEVLRVPGPQPGRPAGARASLERRAGLPSAWERWWIEGAVGQARAAGEVDAVYAWMQPYPTAEAAAQAAAELERPWVADLSDPWALDEMWFYATALHRRRELHRMRRALATAAAIVMSAPEAAARVRAAFPELRDRVAAVPFGYDAEAFTAAAPVRQDDRFRIVHTGEFHTAIGLRHQRHRRVRRLLGGEPFPGVDILARSPLCLLRALERLEPALRDRVELHLAGALSDADEQAIAGSPLVRRHGYLPHAEAVALMRSADLLFLPMQDLPMGIRAGLVPGKTYEYLASGRPILAAVPEGDARDLLREAGAHLVDPTDDAAMAVVIRDFINGASAAPAVPPALLDAYEYAAVTRALAGQLDAAVEGGHGRHPRVALR